MESFVVVKKYIMSNPPSSSTLIFFYQFSFQVTNSDHRSSASHECDLCDDECISKYNFYFFNIHKTLWFSLENFKREDFESFANMTTARMCDS